jgi:hypothetical protein
MNARTRDVWNRYHLFTSGRDLSHTALPSYRRFGTLLKRSDSVPSLAK